MATAGHTSSLQINAHEIGPYVTNVTFTQANDVLDTSTFSATAHTYVNGLIDTKMNISGLWDKTSTVGSHTVLQACVGAGSTAFIWAPEGTTTGNVKHSGNIILATYEESSEVAGLVKFTATASITGAVTTGVF